MTTVLFSSHVNAYYIFLVCIFMESLLGAVCTTLMLHLVLLLAACVAGAAAEPLATCDTTELTIKGGVCDGVAISGKRCDGKSVVEMV